MKAELQRDDRIEISADAIAEIVVWRVPSSVQGSSHLLKYRLAFVVEGVCVLRLR